MVLSTSIEVSGTETAPPREGQAGGIGRRKDEMDVIGHEAMGPNRNAELSAQFCEPIAIDLIVPRLEGNTFTAITPLNHVIWRVRTSDAGDAYHGETLRALDRPLISGESESIVFSF
jgi:hypothetical protein